MKRNISATLVCGYAFLYLPIFFLVVFSFNSSFFPGVWTGLSLRWYRELFSNHVVWNAVKTSLKIASMSATGAVIIGTVCALALTRGARSKGNANAKPLHLLSLITSAPLIMPEVILGLSLLLMFVMSERMFGIPAKRGIGTVTVAHITVAISYVVLIVQARLLDFDVSLEEAALDLGARSFRTILYVTIPIIAPTIVAAWLLTFAISLDDVVIACFLTGAQATTLPILIFSSVKTGITPEMNALATILVAAISALIIVIGLFLFKRTMRRARTNHTA
jgi:putrescine transport system permease protein